MIPFYVMCAAIVIARLAGWLALPTLDNWHDATRVGLAVMFVSTGVAHFTATRRELVRMVPPSLPKPDLLVTLTGVAELAGAVGLLLPTFTRWAALGLIVLLAAMFPANVHAARAALSVGGRPATPLVIRAPLQALWIALLVWVGF